MPNPPNLEDLIAAIQAIAGGGRGPTRTQDTGGDLGGDDAGSQEEAQAKWRKAWKERMDGAKLLRDQYAEGSAERIEADIHLGEEQRKRAEEALKRALDTGRIERDVYLDGLNQIQDRADAEKKAQENRLQDIEDTKAAQDAAHQSIMGGIEGIGAMLGMQASYQETMIGRSQALAEQVGNFTDEQLAELQEQMAETFSIENIGASFFDKVFESTIAAAVAYDTATAAFNKTTGAAGRFNEEMMDSTIGLASMGVGIEDATAAYGALFSNMSSFTNLSKENRVVLGQVVSELDGLGISGETTASNLEFLTQVMGASAEDAAAQQKQLAEFANTLGVAPAKMADEYKAAQPIMVKYGKVVGDQMFKKLSETAKATGVEMSSLLSIAGQFDTFEAAAQATGKLNALLGGPMLNSVELLTANEADRIEMLRQGVQQSGKNWKSMNRFEQQAIASAAGISDMTEAAKLFGTTDAEFSKNAAEQKNLAEMSAKAQSAQEKMNALMMQFAAHVAPVVELLSTVLTFILDIVDAMGPFGKVITTAIMLFGLWQMAIAYWTIATKLGIATQIEAMWTDIKTLAIRIKNIAATWAGVVATQAQALWTDIMTIKTRLMNTALQFSVATMFSWVAGVISAGVAMVASFLAPIGAAIAATWSFTAALLANPIGLIVVAVVALGAALVGLIVYWDELSAGVDTVTSGMFDLWDVLLLLAGFANPFGWLILAGKLVYDNFDAIVSGLQALWEGFVNFIPQSFKDGINAVLGLWNNMADGFTFPADIPIIGGMGLPSIPLLAEGGVITSGGSAIVGEKGPELLTLPAGASVASNKNLKGATAKAGSLAAGPTTVKLILNDREFAKAVIKVMDEKLNLRTG